MQGTMHLNIYIYITTTKNNRLINIKQKTSLDTYILGRVFMRYMTAVAIRASFAVACFFICYAQVGNSYA